jgi:hypothetical protein
LPRNASTYPAAGAAIAPISHPFTVHHCEHVRANARRTLACCIGPGTNKAHLLL